ncbi:hypothetical protein M3J09_009369 [Ascochyta lentis]
MIVIVYTNNGPYPISSPLSTSASNVRS